MADFWFVNLFSFSYFAEDQILNGRLIVDLGMALNTAMFARAGRTGYVLKPELLRQKGTEKDKDTLNKTAEYVLKLQASLYFFDW